MTYDSDWSFPNAETERQARWNAARLLESARWCDPESGLELLDWVLTVVPSSRPARRLQIDLLLRTDHLGDAEAQLARCLLQWPNDHRLRFLRARCLAEAGRVDDARQALESLLRDRPHDRRALLFAARLERLADEPDRAASLLHRILADTPRDEAALAELVEASLAAEDLDTAADALHRKAQPRPALTARVLEAQGRLLDALEIVAGQPPADDPEALELRLRWLIRTANLDAARAVLDTLDTDDPAVCLTAARGRLSLGHFAEADRLAAVAADRPSLRRRALEIRIIAGTLTQDAGVARDVNTVFDEWHRHAGPADRARLAELWIEGFRGELLVRQHDPIVAGADPVDSVLKPLLSDALAALDGLNGDDTNNEPPDRPAPPTPTGTDAALARRCRTLLGLSSDDPHHDALPAAA